MLGDLAKIIGAVQNEWGLAALVIIFFAFIIYLRYKYGNAESKKKGKTTDDTPASNPVSPSNVAPLATTPAVLAPQMTATDPSTASATTSTPISANNVPAQGNSDDFPKTTGKVNNVTISGSNNTVHNITVGDTIYDKSGKN